MPYVTMVRQSGFPHQVSMSVKAGEPAKKFVAGFVHMVSDDEADLLLNEDIGLHRCADGVYRRMFVRTRPAAIPGGAGAQQDDTAASVMALIDALQEAGTLSEEQVATLRQTMPQAAAVTATREPYITRCQTCNEKVRVLPERDDCPNCHGDLRKSVLADPTTAPMTSPESDAELMDDADLP